MRKLLAGLLLVVAVAPSIPWGQLSLPVPNWPIYPSPSPEPTPKPQPTPNPTTSLARLVSDANQRANLARFFDDLATLIERDLAGVIKDLEQLRQANKAAGHLLEQSGAISPNPPFWSEVNRLQAERLGLDPGPLTPQKKLEVSNFYRFISAELSR